MTTMQMRETTQTTFDALEDGALFTMPDRWQPDVTVLAVYRKVAPRQAALLTPFAGFEARIGVAFEVQPRQRAVVIETLCPACGEHVEPAAREFHEQLECVGGADRFED
jgi:hypothetical protein